MSFDDFWEELHEPHTDEQRYYILDLLDSAKQNDEQRRYWLNRLEGSNYQEARDIIDELKAINYILDHPRFGGGGMTFTRWKDEVRGILDS